LFVFYNSAWYSLPYFGPSLSYSIDLSELEKDDVYDFVDFKLIG
jgi:hypothetical protein